MDALEGARFPREELRARYAVSQFEEDFWHRQSDRITAAIFAKYLHPALIARLGWVLNAGAGVTQLGVPKEISLDLFPEPIAGKQYPVCATISRLPFQESIFDAVVCVGEVLAYCDPRIVTAEFARVIRSRGRLIIDFGSTRSWRVFGSSSFGASAALLISDYNGSEENTWIYDPEYIVHVLHQAGFDIVAVHGSHRWSSLARRLRLSLKTAIKLEQLLSRTIGSAKNADTVTIVCDLRGASLEPEPKS